MAGSDMELALLQLTLQGVDALRPEAAAAAALGPEEAEVLQLVLKGDWVAALRHASVQAILAAHDNVELTGPAEYFAFIQDRLQGTAQGLPEGVALGGETGRRALLAAVSCLGIFMQYNLSGPMHSVAHTPSPLELFARHIKGAAAPAPSTAEAAASAGLGQESAHPHERWAASVLQLDGEELLGRFNQLQYLLLAEVLLLAPLLQQKQREGGEGTPQGGSTQAPRLCDLLQRAAAKPRPSAGAPAAAGAPATSQAAPSSDVNIAGPVSLSLQPDARDTLTQRLPSWMWWALRATALHQHVLAGRAPTLLSRAGLFMSEMLTWCERDTPGPEGLDLSGHRAVQGALYMELAMVQYMYGFIEPGARYLDRAGQLLGLQVELSGAMGKRTVHQIDAKAQLVVVATRERLGGAPVAIVAAAAADGDAAAADAGDMEVEALGIIPSEKPSVDPSDPGAKETAGLTTDEDVFVAPVIVEESGKVLESRYSGLEQALLLGWCTHLRKGTARDELQAWHMAPYVEAVLSQKRSQFMLQAAALLHKVRHERTRSRTRERALLRAEQLMDALALPPTVTEPSSSSSSSATAAAAAGGDEETRRAAAVSRMRYAFAVWFPLQVALKKEVAEQYISMGFIGAALRSLEELELWDNLIVCYRMLGKKGQAEELIQRRLKVTPDDPRLWNTLGDLHMDDSHYREAWERSGHRNARSQRSLGRSALGRKDYAAAAEHFSLAVTLNPLHIESWFSMGYAYVKVNEWEKALKAFTRVTQQDPDHGEAWNNIAALWTHLGRFKEAFSALSHCVKHKRDSWQVWENYAHVAAKCRNYVPAARGLKQVLELSQGQRLKVDVADALVQALEDWGKEPQGSGQGSGADDSDDTSGANRDQGAGAVDDGEEDEAAASFVLPGLPLLGSVPLPNQDVDAAGDEGMAAEAASLAAQRQELLDKQDERMRQQLLASISGLLKQAVNASCCTPEVWGLLGRVYGLQGELEAKKEALLKQVRSMTTTAFKSDETQFESMARASLHLCSTYVALYEAGTAPPAESSTAADGGAAGAPAAGSRPRVVGGVRDLAAARMHLRGVLKQCEARFAEHQLYKDMQGLLDKVVELEAAATSARSG